MTSVVVIFIGGPRHGELEALDAEPLAAPKTLSFPTLVAGERGEAVYDRNERADTPGRIAYVYRPLPASEEDQHG